MKRTNKKFSAPTAWKQCGASMRRAALSLLTLVMAFTAQTAWADYGWYNGASMSIGGITTDVTVWSSDGSNPTDLGIVDNMTITSIAFNVWSDANDRVGAYMYFRVYDDNGQVGNDQDLWLGPATRITGDHDFAISWTGTLDLADAVSLTLIPGKTYYIDMWAKTYGSSGDEWISGDNSSNYHAKLTIRPANYVSGDCTATLNDGVLTISKTGSGTGAMADYGEACDQPWAAMHSDIKAIVIEDGVTSIGNYAFSMCEYVTSGVSIPASVTSIGNYSFNYCSMTSLTIPSNSSLETIGSFAFNCCSSLPSATIPASVKSIGSFAFDACTNLTTVTLNSNPSIGESAFKDGATVAMNLTNDPVDGAYWMTFYNENYSFEADANTQVFKAALSGTTLTLTELTTDKIVNKNNAVILKSTANPIVMTLKTTDGSNNFTGNSLQGVKDPAGVTAANPSTIYVLNYKDEIGVGFYRLASTKKVGVGKAYLIYDDSIPDPGTGGAREFLSFGDTTGINDVRCQKEDVRGEYYDLQGRRVSHPTKGLYIVNGKKVVIK